MERDERKYWVFNATDGIFAHPDAMTLEEAEEFVRLFPKRFEAQGYYLTASWDRIPPDAVELVIVGEDADVGELLDRRQDRG